MPDAGAFGSLLVVELDGSRAGAYCGRLFAGLGAEVVAVGAGPTGPGSEFYRQATDHRPDAGPGDAETAELLRSADLVIQSSAIDPISEPHMPAGERQVVLRISPFASEGPYAHWRSTDLVDAAIAGHLRLTGDPAREPLQGVPDLVDHAAGVTGFIAAVAALVARARGGRGQSVEVTHHEVLVALHQFTLSRFTHNGAVLNRHGNRYAGPGAVIGAYECADGWLSLVLPQEDQVERLLEVTGLITLLERPDVDSLWDLMTDIELFDRELVPYLNAQGRDETVELFQALRLPCAPISELNEVVEDPHLAARGFWRSSEAGHRIPGPPFHIGGRDWFTEPSRRTGPGPAARSETSHPEEADLTDGPLTGLRVIDMTRVWAGPLAARILADLGAEVLMTEVPWTRTPREVAQSYVDGTHFFPDDEAGKRPWNRSAFHNKYAINKLSTVIELNSDDGRDLFARLVPTADVLIENYSPRVMPDLGFDEGRLQELNPKLIYLTMPGYGRSGPHTDWVAYGPSIDGHVGHTAMVGYRGEGPWKCGIAWPDPIGGLHGAAAVLVALLDRYTEPERPGRTIEIAQIESAINMIGHHVVAAQRNGPPPRLGNRRPGRAPQGVYPCAGDDRWIAVSVTDEQAWRGLCDVLGFEDLRALDREERQTRHDELDGRIAAATAPCDDLTLMVRLQEAGVPAGAAFAAPEIMDDPELDALKFFGALDHPDAGSHRWPRFPGRLADTPATLRRPAPLMGQHNDYAARTLAGCNDEQYRELTANGVLLDTPPN